MENDLNTPVTQVPSPPITMMQILENIKFH